jgi:hypothetical protein
VIVQLASTEVQTPVFKPNYFMWDDPEPSSCFLCRYYQQEDIKDANLMGMYPPGKIIFMRPLKTVKGKRTVTHLHAPKQKCWDAVWISAYELIGEGILLSKAVRAGPCHVVAEQPCMESI